MVKQKINSRISLNSTIQVITSRCDKKRHLKDFVRQCKIRPKYNIHLPNQGKIIEKPIFHYIHLAKVDFKSKRIIRDGGGLFKVANGSIQQEDLMILNVYATNYLTTKYMKAKQEE